MEDSFMAEGPWPICEETTQKKNTRTFMEEEIDMAFIVNKWRSVTQDGDRWLVNWNPTPQPTFSRDIVEWQFQVGPQDASHCMVPLPSGGESQQQPLS